MTATFLAIAAALSFLSIGLSRVLAPSAQSQVGLVLLVAAGLGAVVAGIFPTDVTADDSPVTATGFVHILAGVTAFVCVTVASLLVSRNLARDTEWRAFQRPALTLAIAIVAGFVVFIVAQPLGGRGIGQRIFLGTVLVWILFMAIRLRDVAKVALSQPQRPEAPAYDRS